MTTYGRRISGSPCTSTSILPSGHLAVRHRDAADYDVGLLFLGEGDDLLRRGAFVFEHPIAFRLQAGALPELVREFAAAGTVEVHERRAGSGDFLQRLGAVLHPADARRVARGADDGVLVARPRTEVRAEAVGDEIGRLVAAVHGEHVHLAALERLGDHGSSAR